MAPLVSQEQVEAWECIAGVLPPDAYLAGGVAVALHLGHRESRDLDIFMTTSNPEELAGSLPASVTIRSRARHTLHLDVGAIPVSLIRYPYALLVEPSSISPISGPVASLDDLACMKLSAIANRGARRDFWDLREIAAQRNATLESLLEAFRRKYPRVDTGHVVRALAYFGDAETEPLPRGLTEDAWRDIRAMFESWVVGFRL